MFASLLSVDWTATNILLCALSAWVSFALALFALQRRNVRGAVWFSLLVSATGWINVWYIFEALAGMNLDAYLAFSKIEYVGLTMIPMLWVGFAFCFSGRDAWFTPGRILLLATMPVLTILVAWTNEYHGLIWGNPHWEILSRPPVFSADYGAVFWVYVVYSYILYLFGTVELLRVASRRYRAHRAQSLALVIGAMIPWMSNLVEIFDLSPLPGLYTNGLGAALCMVALAYALFRLRLLDIMPLAHEVIINSLPDGVAVLDCDNRIVMMNPTLRRSLPSVANPLGLTLDEILPEHRTVWTALDGITDTRVVHTVGDRSIELRISPILDRRGTVRGRLFIFNDVTLRAQVEKQAKELNRRVEALTVAQWVYREIGWSSKVSELAHLTLDAALRISAADAGYLSLVSDNTYTIAEQYGGYVGDALLKLAEERAGILGQVLAEEHSVWIQQPAPLVSAPDMTPGGTPAAASHTSRSAPLISAPDMTPGGTPAMASHTSRSAPLVSALDGTTAQIAVPCFTTTTEGERRLSAVIVVETKTAAHFTSDRVQLLELVASRFAAALENTQLIETVQQRNVALEELYDRVSRLEHIKSDMIRIAAHDLRNPLSVIIGYLQLMLEMETDGETLRDAHEYMMKMEGAGRRMQQIIHDVLSLQRIEQLVNQPAIPFDLVPVVNEAIAEMRDHAQDKRQQVVVSVPGTPIIIAADSTQMRQAIVNFISNAIKYTPAGGTIWVTLHADDTAASFEVRDTGYGIPQEMQPRLFEPFFRARTEETASIEGTGLGLHLVKNIVERYDGKIVFESSYGKGSTFGFRFALHTAHPAAVAGLPAPAQK